MIDLRATIIPKSDQLNADDLIAGPMTITVSRVLLTSASDQPVAIHYEGDNGKPYMACKSMRRVLVHAWGPDGAVYPGRSMTIYRDPAVKFGGAAVGGIRISHVSHIERELVLALTESRGSRKPYIVKPLRLEPKEPAAPAKPKLADWLRDVEADLAAAEDAEAVQMIRTRPDVAKALTALQGEAAARLAAALQNAMDRVMPFPGDAEDGAEDAL